jgi:hypothetical protein
MKPAELVERIPGSRPVAGLAGAWTWNLARFRRYAFLDASGTTVFRMNTSDGDHPDAFRRVVDFARTLPPVRFTAPVVTAPGFSAPGYAFDTLAIARRDVYDYDENEFPDLSAVSLVVFPAYASEFSGRESAADARYLVTRARQISELCRKPVPFLKVKYRNPAVGGATAGAERHFMPFDALQREIRQLDGVTDAYVEFETCTGAVWRITWSDGFRFEGPTTVILSLAAALEFAHAATEAVWG